MTDQPPLQVARLDLAYQSQEDRLIVQMSGSEGQVGLLLTRRLCGALIDALSGVIEKSSATAAHISADARDAVILMEHQLAVGEGSERAAAQPPRRTKTFRFSKKAPRLITEITIKHDKDNFKLLFSSERLALAHLKLGRTNLHKFLEVLVRQAASANWRLKPRANWLDPSQVELTIN